MTSEIKVDTISEQTSANGVTIDGLTIKDGNIIGDVALAGTTPTFTIGDAGAEDAALIFDGNAQDFYIALDDSADDLIIGLGAAVGTTPMLSFTEAKAAAFTGAVSMATTLTLTGNADFNGNLDVDGTSNLDVVDIDGALTQDGGAVFNEASADVDFRVESNGNANMLFVDGGNDRIGIGNASPSTVLHLKGGGADNSVGAPIITIHKRSGGAVDDGQTIGGLSFVTNDDGVNSGSDYERAKIIAESQNTSSATRLEFWTSNNNADIAEHMRIIGDGTVVINSAIALGDGLDGGTANRLDDYEEGTWTPSLAGSWNSNPTNMSGKYAKIGRIVTLSMIWQNGAKSNSTSAHFTSLPFSVLANSTAPVSDTGVDDNGIVLCDTGGRIFTTANSFGSDNNYLTVTYISDT